MAHTDNRGQWFGRSSKVLLLSGLLASLLTFYSLDRNPSEDPAARAKELNDYLAREGIERIPAKGFEFPPLVEESELDSTIVAPSLATKLPSGKNVVYCATQKIVEAAKAQALAGQRMATPAVGVTKELPVGSYRFLNGSPEEIQSQLAETFPSSTETLDFLREGEQWGCYFQRNLPFLEAFERLEEPLEFRSPNGVAEVACFGDRMYVEDSVQQSLRKDQITIVDFRNEDDFIVQLNTEVQEDVLILAKVQPEEFLESTLKGVLQRVKKNPLGGSEQSVIQEGEALVVPVLTVNLLKRFQGLLPGFQTIRFRLDEKGAVLDSYIGFDCEGSGAVLRQMVFDKPFLLYLKSKAAESPYFVLWVENLEVMEAFVAEAEEG